VNDGKLEPRAMKCIFLGYPTGVKGYRLWCTENNRNKRFIISRDVTFNESAMFGQKEEVENIAGNKGVHQKVELEVEDSNKENLDPIDQSSNVQEEPQSIATRRTKREIRKPARYADVTCVVDTNSVSYALAVGENLYYDEPKSYKNAIQSKEASEWLIAMNEEMQSLKKNQTWELVPLPKGVKPVGCKWVFKKKEGILDVEPSRFKARLVAKGFSQKEGIDYHEVFSPVVKHKTIRVLLAMVSALDMELEQLDVKTAFLHENLEEQIYMSQPDGFLEVGKENHVCLLKKVLVWFKTEPEAMVQEV